MKRFCIAWLIMMGLGTTAAAQAPEQSEPTSASFLEKRVPEELATQGITLSHRNLALQIEQLADTWLVSLVDLTTGRVAATTKVDALPADREAAVAIMTRVAAELTAQIGGRSQPLPPPPPAPVAAPPPVIDDREHEQRELAELRFRRQSLRFGSNLQLTAINNVVNVHRSWVVHQGDLDEDVEPTAFYAKVGRPDLAQGYTRRKYAMIGGFVASGAALAVGSALLFYELRDQCPMTLSYDAFTVCEKDHRPTFGGPLIALGTSAIAFTVGIWYFYHPHPISENDAKALADAYNQRLRRELGLPVVTREPLLHDVKLTPLVARGDAGLVLGARF
jgi:hypothetical protein